MLEVPALFVLTSMLEDWVGEGPAIIHWAAWSRGSQLLPWSLSTMIADIDDLTPAQRTAAAEAVNRFFSWEEAQSLWPILLQETAAGNASLRYGRIELPLMSDEAVAMQRPNPRGSRTLWRLRPPDPILPGSPLAIEGIVSLWPWPGLAPSDIAPLMAMRERLGNDPIPSMPGRRKPSPPNLDD